MKKALLVIGIVFGIFILITIIIAVTTPEGKKSFDTGIQQGKEVVENKFGKDDAIKKVQEYRLQKDFSNIGITKGDTLLDYYNKRGNIPAIKNESWSAEETKEQGKYIVSFRATIDQMANQPRWEVTNTIIKALNGAAITLTPELGPQETKQSGSANEQEVYQYSIGLYKQYIAEAGDSVEKQREAEDQSIKETAQKFNISEKEVSDIISKLQ